MNWQWIDEGIFSDGQPQSCSDAGFEKLVRKKTIKPATKVLHPKHTGNTWQAASEVSVFTSLVIRIRDADQKKREKSKAQAVVDSEAKARIRESKKQANAEAKEKARVAANQEKAARNRKKREWTASQEHRGETLDKILESVRSIATYVAVAFWLWIVLSVIGCMAIVSSQSRF